MTKIKIHNPCNKHTRYYRNYNLFWDKFTDFLKIHFDVEENRFFENAHSERFPINLNKGVSGNLLILECEYVIENLDNGEFVIMSVADDLNHCILNEQSNPFLKKVLVSQFDPEKILNHTRENFFKYSPWTYFQSQIIDLENYYNKRKDIKELDKKIFFKGTSLEDRSILKHIDQELITDFRPEPPDSYFNQIINHKIALSVDGRGEFCYRDVECFGVGVPIIRYEYVSKFYSELIPNYHYISIKRPSDMTSYRAGTEEHAKKLIERYNEVIEEDNFLNFVSNNAREYYINNVADEAKIKNTFNLLNLHNWL